MKRNKILASLLALSLTLGLTIPAFAVDPDPEVQNGKAEFTVATQLKLPTIKVTIATPSQLIVNPYKMTFDASGIGLSNAETDSLIASAGKITSTSNISMKVSATATATPSSGGSLKILTARPTTGSEPTEASVLLTLSMVNVTKDDVDNNKLNDASVWTSATPQTVKESGSTPVEITLAAADATNTSVYGAYKFDGESYGTTWTNNDTMDLKVVFNIEPVISTT